MKKAVKVLSTAALLSSLAVPFAAPVSAKSVNGIDRVATVDDDYDFSTNLAGAPKLNIKEDSDFKGDFRQNDTFRLVLSEGASWNYPKTADTDLDVNGNVVAAGTGAISVRAISDSTLEVKVNTVTPATGNADAYQIPMNVDLDGAAGDVKVTVDPRDSAVTGGTYTFAVAANGKTVAVAEDKKTIGKNGTLGTIRIDETNIGAVSGNHTITLKVPSGYEFTGANVSFGGGYVAVAPTPTSTVGVISANGRTLTIPVTLINSTANRGSIYITPSVKVDGASEGDITVSVSGTAGNGATGSIADADVVPGKYADWGGSLKIDEVKEFISGKVDNIQTGEISIKESVPGSFIAGRDIDVELPSWVKVVGVTGVSYSSALTGGAVAPSFTNIDGTKSKFSFTLGSISPSTSKQEIKFKLQLSVQADKEGDIEAVVKGAGLAESKLVVAKAVAPISASVEKVANVKIGTQAQEVGDLVITENKKEAIEKNPERFDYTAGINGFNGTGAGASRTLATTANGSGTINIDLPTGVSFATTPTVEVVDGNAEVEKDGVSRTSVNGGYNNRLVVQLKSESTKPAKIKISGIKLTADRTVPEGDIEAKIGGSAIVENNDGQNNASSVEAGEFGVGTAAKVVIAKTVTPAPGDTTASNIVFKLNSKTFTVDGKAQEMDAAPLVGWDRAFLPVRFAANALNVSDSNIIWDDKTSTFTIFKGDRVITGKVGDKFLTVNGVKVPMDVPVWRNKAQTNNRVMVPIRYLANALNANIEWNKETSEITISAAK